ncbi:hypothetical protein CHLNCDRAFT_143005 [Chlorella variabilis]|uniref:Uncharacterized protein n=1 Tax=Chlorella variabilis TaxID=554065 RepID=E1Z9A0_CHLVA|nr:hypothetical protein CHLNCDRAFT_143005 [Chlorella variabilis]EFN57741.1 hypothetical protein CHLNCDRAFT_143005 [Chlorella variabilis]|eukprot:XP_005849843.1 hypothetical protein CHLNCDRAFT_143005 [Chlorella variabilis]
MSAPLNLISGRNLISGHTCICACCNNLRRLLSLRRRLLVARAEEQREGSSAAAAADEEPIAAEQLLRRKKGKAGAGFKPSPASAKEGPTVISPVRDQVYGGGPLTAEQQAENSVVGLLAALFFVILAEGIYVAASGFMPQALDQFAQDVVLPAFTPTLGLFLAISTAYGLWKTRAGPDGQQ